MPLNIAKLSDAQMKNNKSPALYGFTTKFELEQQARQNLSTINFTATFIKTSSCNTLLEKGLNSAKASVKKAKSQILKGSDPEWAIRLCYGSTCDYFEIMEKRIFIQQRVLACLSKSVAHILQLELYTMGNTGVLRREAEMTLIIPIKGTRDIRK